MSDQIDLLAEQECLPCLGGVIPLKGDALTALHAQLGSEWQLIDEHHLERHYAFRDFSEALGFTNLVGTIAEALNHHPDILTAWGKVVVTIWTHKIGGLTESDFVFSAKVEKAFRDAM